MGACLRRHTGTDDDVARALRARERGIAAGDENGRESAAEARPREGGLTTKDLTRRRDWTATCTRFCVVRCA